jgi:mycofactocin precursor
LNNATTRQYTIRFERAPAGSAENIRKEVYVEDKSVPANEVTVKQDPPAGMEDPLIMEEFEIEELSVDGICGVY